MYVWVYVCICIVVNLECMYLHMYVHNYVSWMDVSLIPCTPVS